MSRPQQRYASYADIEALPPHVTGEIAYGILHTRPRPAPRHAQAAGGIQAKVGGPFHYDRGGPGGWVIVPEPELHLGPHVLVPDVAGWRRQQMAKLPETAYFEVAPDWLCEVLSPSTARFDRTDKLAIYATFGARHVWLVDPDARTLEALEQTASGQWLLAATFKDDDLVVAPPFEAGAFDLGALWGE